MLPVNILACQYRVVEFIPAGMESVDGTTVLGKLDLTWPFTGANPSISNFDIAYSDRKHC